ncbi:MAG: hypothetical protein SGILL_006836 [Bacillariaceae sp.]
MAVMRMSPFVFILLLAVATLFCYSGLCAAEEAVVEVGANGVQQKRKDDDPVGDLMKKIFGAFNGDKGQTPDDNKPLFESLGEETETETKEEAAMKTEEAESIWNLMFPKTTDTDRNKDQEKRTDEETNLGTWEQMLLKAKEHQMQQKGSDVTSFTDNIQILKKAFDKVKDQMDRAFDGLDLSNMDLLQAWYVSQAEEHNKSPVWKRQQHRFQDPLQEEQALALADALYLNGLAYADTCAEIEHHLKGFRNDSWVLVNCTTQARPEEPAHYVAVRKQPPEEQQSSWFKKPQKTLEVAFVVRATKDLMDILTDALLEASPFHGGLAHHGIRSGALYLYELYKDWLPELLAASQSDKMAINTVGYSLGAGVAALLTMEFNKQFPENIRTTSVGMGTPAVLTRELSESVKSTITTVVSDADCVSRMSGPAVYNMFVRATNYNWTMDALRDFDQIMPFLQEHLPLGDMILSNETIAKGRKDLTATLLDKFEKSLNLSLPTALESGTKIQEIELFPPGTCIHLYRDGTSWQGNFVSCFSFDEQEIVGHLLDDHLLNTGYYPALVTYIRKLKNDFNFKVEHDVMDLSWVRKDG